MKLITAYGKSSDDDQFIRASFDAPISIAADSKVIVRYAHANVLGDDFNRSYDVIAGDFTWAPDVSGSPSLSTVSFPTRTYDSTQELLHDFQIKMNSTGEYGDQYLGLHHNWELNGNTATIRTSRAPMETTVSGDWVVNDPTGATISNGSIQFLGTGTEEVAATYPSFVTACTHRYDLTVNNLDNFEVMVSNYDATDSEGGAFGYNGTWYYLKDGDGAFALDTLYSPTNGDQLSYQKAGSNHRLIVKNAAGVTQNTISQPLGANALRRQAMFYVVTAPAASVADLTNMTCTTLDDASPLRLTVKAEMEITLNSKSLAGILGLKNNKTLVYEGDPAILRGEKPMSGSTNFPGILLVCNQLMVESYVNGRSRSQPNYLTVIHPQAFTNEIDYQNQSDRGVSLINQDQIIRNLDFNFVLRSSDLTTRLLQFTGTAVIELEILEPGE